MELTPTVFCAVTAVIALVPWTPQRANALRSAGIRPGDRERDGRRAPAPALAAPARHSQPGRESEGGVDACTRGLRVKIA